MLNVSGIEALGQIKAINPEIPVIIMTAIEKQYNTPQKLDR